jgi:4-amino-4-deoxy-L-arabinose transferase-like glycosyltransferase
MVAGARTLSLEETFLPANVLNPPPTRHALLTFLLALAAILHIGTAAWGDLYDGMEGQIAGGAREMLRSGQWLIPTNNGAPQLGTPPLACWAVAISYKIFGISATAARLPIVFAMIGSVALTFLIGERLAGYWRGFAAGLFYLCSAGTFVLGRLVAPENFFCLFVAAALYCAICGYQRQKFRRFWFAGFWISAALATLAKGPDAFFFLGGTLAILSLFFREARLRFAVLLHWTNLLLFVVIAAPWFVWAHKHFPGFAAQFFSAADEPSLARWRFLLSLLACWFPGLFLILPGLILAPRKIFRPNELTFADAVPVCLIAVGLLIQLLTSARHLSAAVTFGPGFALLAACGWERTSQRLRGAGVALSLLTAVVVAAAIWFGPASIDAMLARPLSDAVWFSLRPLAQIAVGAFLVSALAAFASLRQRGEVMLALALVAMVPAGFCLVESGARAAPFLSLADAAEYLNPRLGRTGEVIYEGPLPTGSSLSFYLDKKFYLVNQKPAAFERDPVALEKYLDEHFLLEAWDRSDPLYMIVDESRVAYWRQQIVQRVHIYHQVTTCGRRVVLSNQL